MKNIAIDSLIETADFFIREYEQAETAEVKQKYIDFLIGVSQVATFAKFKTKSKETRMKFSEISDDIHRQIAKWSE